MMPSLMRATPSRKYPSNTEDGGLLSLAIEVDLMRAHSAQTPKYKERRAHSAQTPKSKERRAHTRTRDRC